MKLKIISGIALILGLLVCSCQSDDQLTYMRYYTSGSVVYQNKCQNCHGKNGEGLSALMPPLTDSIFLKANKASLSCFIKYGIKGKVLIINKKPFENDMPSIDLSPLEIAQVLTYVTNSYGNKMGVLTTEQAGEQLKGCQ